MHLCIECSLFELYEYDEIGDHDGDGGGESGPVHVEQSVPGDPDPLCPREGSSP